MSASSAAKEKVENQKTAITLATSNFFIIPKSNIINAFIYYYCLQKNNTKKL
jgi:hypothetical protein